MAYSTQLNPTPIISELPGMTTYRVERFVWTVEDTTVVLTRDDRDGGVTCINRYDYANNEQANEYAWRMACRQCKA